MTSLPLERTHGRMTSGMAFCHRLWAAHMIERCRAWHAIIASGKHKLSNDVARGMLSSPLGSTNYRTTSGVACHHGLRTAHTVGRHRAMHAIFAFLTAQTVEQRCAWHDITALGLHARSDDVRRGMTSAPFDSIHGQQRRSWHDITALGKHTWSATSCVVCHHRPSTAHTV